MSVNTKVDFLILKINYIFMGGHAMPQKVYEINLNFIGDIQCLKNLTGILTSPVV